MFLKNRNVHTSHQMVLFFIFKIVEKNCFIFGCLSQMFYNDFSPLPLLERYIQVYSYWEGIPTAIWFISITCDVAWIFSFGLWTRYLQKRQITTSRLVLISSHLLSVHIIQSSNSCSSQNDLNWFYTLGNLVPLW